MLLNPSFEGGWTRKTHTGQEWGEIYVPSEWTAYWKEGLPVPHDPTNQNGYGRPEAQVINKEAPFLDPPRIYSGSRSFKLFTFYRVHWAGLYQRVEVTPGSLIRFSGFAHAWSSTEDSAKKSTGVTSPESFMEGTAGLTDAQRNFTFRVGIDPYGMNDPWSKNIIWGKGKHIYNKFDQIPEVEVTAISKYITVFVQSEVLYPFKHNDFYCDDMRFEEIPGSLPPNPECKGLPRIDYERTVHLMPKNPTKAQREKVTEAAYPNRETIGYSADDGGIGDLSVKTVKVWWFTPTSWTSKAAMDNFFAQYYPGTTVIHIVDYAVEPPTGFVPENYTPVGCKTNFHGTADDGITDIQVHLKDRGARMVTAKAVADYGWLDIIHSVDPTCDTIVRPIQWKGANMEWFDPNKDPYVQAENRMNALYDFFQIHKKYTKFFEIMNEQDPPGEEGQANLARFFIRAMEMANDWGIHLAIFSHSTGVPEPKEWDAIAETGVFEKCAAGGHAISLHGYGFMPQDATYHLFRHRDLYNRIILPRNLNIPCFITEYNTVPFENEVWRKLTDAEIINQLAMFDAELAKDPYVVGAHIFTLGSGWDWCRNRWSAIRKQYEDYAVSVKNRVNSPSTTPAIKTLIGINDPENTGASGWLSGKGDSLLVLPFFIGGTSRKLDFTTLAAKGIKVIVNLRYSWSTDMGGGGTLPAPITIEFDKFINAAAETINNSVGVYAWEIGNEYNNPREWPTNKNLIAEDVALIYNKIRAKVGDIKMCPGAVDPFNAVAGDPREWVRKIYNTITGAGMTTFHGYTRGAQPENVDSPAKFTDAPLEYQYLNYSGCIETLREALPNAYKILPVYITEFNHLTKYNGTYGWENDENAMVTINKAYAAAQRNGYSGIAMYRWQGDDWTIKDKGNLLYAIENIIKS